MGMKRTAIQGTRLSRKFYLNLVRRGGPQNGVALREVGHDQGKSGSTVLLARRSVRDSKARKVASTHLHDCHKPRRPCPRLVRGSGTTGAVAHKMGRRWIMVELGEHCHTHIIPRLKKGIDGADPGGITEAVGWKGGGGFRYYRLAPSLLEKDKWGNWVISKEYNAAMLAEALQTGRLHYAPSDTVYWQHGHSTERDFIYVTTQHLSTEQLPQLSDEVGSERSLARLVLGFPWRKRRTDVPEPDRQEDPNRPHPLRMGPRRLQPEGREPAKSAAEGRPAAAARRTSVVPSSRLFDEEVGQVMNRHVNAIAGRLSLRPPQRRSLEILDRITEIVPPKKGADLEAALAASAASFRRSRISSASFRRSVSRWPPASARRGSWARSSAICTSRTASTTSSCSRRT